MLEIVILTFDWKTHTPKNQGMPYTAHLFSYDKACNTSQGALDWLLDKTQSLFLTILTHNVLTNSNDDWFLACP